MTAISVVLPVLAGGRSILTLNLCARREGTQNDRMSWRIVRRMSGQADAVLVGTPEMTFQPDNDTKSWTWVDDTIPVSGAATYALQVYRMQGGGYVNEIVLLGQHYKR